MLTLEIRRPEGLLFALGLSLVLGAPSVARAEAPVGPAAATAPPAAAVVDGAKKLFAQAVGVFNQGDYPLAIAEFEAAYRMYPRASILCNVGLAQKRLFRYVQAIASMKRCLTEDTGLTGDKRAETERLVADMARLLVDVSFDVSPPGAQLLVDGHRAGLSPLPPIPLLGGVHVVEVSAEGFESTREEVTVVAGAPQSIQVALKAIPRTGRVRIVASVVGAQVSIDGSLAGASPLEADFAAGGHILSVTAPGFARYQGELTVGRGELRTVPIVLDALPEPPRAVPLYKRWWIYTVPAVLVAGGVIAGVAVVESQPTPPPATGLGGTQAN